jgi:aminopeptidase N/puromycin-sensitive aminopeptidase
MIDRRETSLRLDGCGQVFANADSRGYYFTDYSPDLVRAIAKSPSSLKASEWINFLGNEWWMVRAGRHDIDVYLDVADALSTSTAPDILDMLLERLTQIETSIASPDEVPRFAAWVRARFGPALASLGPVELDESDVQQRRRAALMMIVAVVGNDTDAQRRARQLAERYLDNPRSLPPSLAPTVLYVAAIGGDRTLYDRFLFNALPLFNDPALVTRTLDYAISPAVRSQDAATLIAPLLESPASAELTWEFVKTHWPVLLKQLDVFQALPKVVQATGGFCSTARAAEVKEFFTRNRLPSSDRAVQLALERIENCVALDRRQSAPFSTWLQQH